MGQVWVEVARRILSVLGEIYCALLPGSISQEPNANPRFQLLLNLVRPLTLAPQKPF